MVANYNDDYYQVYRCGNCEKGFIGKAKDNTPGFKVSFEYLCKYCESDSQKGELIASETGTDMMPTEFGVHMTLVSTKEEHEVWSHIWWNK